MAWIHKHLETEILDQIDLFPKQANQIDSPQWRLGQSAEKVALRKVTGYADF